MNTIAHIVAVCCFALFASGCRCNVSGSAAGGAAPMARGGSESWNVDGKTYQIASTYYLALPDGLQYTIEYELPPGLSPGALTDVAAYDLAFPVMRYAWNRRLYERQRITELGAGHRSVSRIGVALFRRTPTGNEGYRVARTLGEIQARAAEQTTSSATSP